MEYLPTEVLIELFSYLNPRQLLQCRKVCWRWNEIINSLPRDESYWEMHSRLDFTDVYLTAKMKAKHHLSWQSLYRSLFLWSKLHYAVEIHREIATSFSINNDVCGFQLLRNGKIGVHTRSGIVYFDVATLRRCRRDCISGEYLRYVENDDAIIILAITSDLYIIRKVLRSPRYPQQGCFPYVKHFILNNDDLYYVTLDNDIYVCNIHSEKLVSRLVKRMATGVICLGYKNGLQVLTIDRDICTIINNEYIFRRKLNDTHNILDTLNQYNFIENLDWRAHFHWIFVLRQIVPTGFLRDISIIKIYGKMVFVGSTYGVFSMYNTPYLNGQFDLFNSIPIMHYNFMDRYAPHLTNCPILQIDVIEGEDCHKVVIGMPKKIMVLQFYHEYE